MTRKPAVAEKPDAVPPANPLKPRPRLFVGLCIAFALCPKEQVMAVR